MRHRLFRTLAVALFVVVCALLVVPTYAAADAKLEISPTKLDLGGAAGTSQVVPVSVTAAGDTPLTVTFRHVDFGLRDDYSIVTYEDNAPETTSFSTRRWFSVPKPTYTIGVGETVQVPVTVTIPKNTPGGTYLGIPMFVGTPPSDGAQIQIPIASGPLLFIAVDGGSKPQARITKFELPGVVKSGPVTAQLRVTNDGDDFLSLTGTVRIDGTRRGQATIDQQYVLPDQPRTIQRSSGTNGAKGKQLVVGSDHLGLGRHTVEVRLTISPTNATVVRTHTFWVIPVWAWITGVLLVLLVIGAIAALVVWFVGRRSTTAASTPETEPTEATGDPDAGEFDELLGVEPVTGHSPAHDDDIDAGIDPLLDGFDQADLDDESSDDPA